MEPIRVFLDTNVVLDYFTGRMRDHLAETLVSIGQTDSYRLVISILTAVNTLYIARKAYGNTSLTPFDFERLFEIAPMTVSGWDEAKNSVLSDFEDALQLSCAKSARCSLVISRDNHFNGTSFPVFSPEDFVSRVI